MLIFTFIYTFFLKNHIFWNHWSINLWVNFYSLSTEWMDICHCRQYFICLFVCLRARSSPSSTWQCLYLYTLMSLIASWYTLWSSRLRSSGSAGEDDLSESCSDIREACSTSANRIFGNKNMYKAQKGKSYPGESAKCVKSR